MHPYSYREMVKEAKASLSVSGGEIQPATLLLEDLFEMNMTRFLLDGDKEVPALDRARYEAAIRRISEGEPYQYVVGHAWFYGEKFTVTEDTLIPRNETEELVEIVLAREQDTGKTVVDIGCGTGAIGLTLSAAWQNNTVILTDVSEPALRVAGTNAEKLGMNPDFLSGHLFEPLVERNIKVDCVVSNPPYIGKDELGDMGGSVIAHEPALALFAEDDGLALYKQMVDQLDSVLNERGTVYFEIGWKQADVLRAYIRQRWPGVEPKVEKDMNGNDRILHFRWEVQYEDQNLGHQNGSA
ncbi:peptide chain release factor N(5)-glutamine methyltransferase [Salinicoccus cyprini]|uniref:peptide chain release factor N(5)-glutamine methyltransferase n=1 Tax=Salinicoccus cyprini TaxID=2493691 RepID=A0A558ASL2_9STAP|nr:peptide chain release factor N(5)-glutamine methyltransferase [Salinicoccus cyprini]TVT27251.1 peptide chain release factor N(5)-glutamine methyltransferase [Salinicoccus cyprini]